MSAVVLLHRHQVILYPIIVFSSRGGGAGGPKGFCGYKREPVATDGGIGDNGNGKPGTLGKKVSTCMYEGLFGAGGGDNPSEILHSGLGGIGAENNNLVINPSNMETITINEIAQKINGGNGSIGTSPAKRPARTGISAADGGGGGGSWTDGEKGGKATAPGFGVNGKGGEGGKGGTGSIWIMKIR